MSAAGPVLSTAADDDRGNKGTQCPLYGCKRVYTDASALETHIKEHAIPAQSLPGKVLLCSTVGCGGSFPDMQKLMEHMRQHYKPNIYFLCESCRTKLRSYRGLLTHLHTCSKVPRGKTKPAEAAGPPTPAVAATTNPIPPTPMATDVNLSQLDTVLTSQQQPPGPNPGSNFPVSLSQSDSSATPPCSPKQEQHFSQMPLQQLKEATPQPQPRSEASDLPPPQTLAVLAVAPNLTDIQSQTRPVESVHLSPGSTTPLSSPGSPAVWRKSQGMATNRRILWEHTRGRYTCVQCGHIVSNRKDMTSHISSHHSGNKQAEDAESHATSS